MKTLKKTILTVVVAIGLVGGSVPAIPTTTVAHAKTTYVWIAPNHGKKYHYSKGCRGLSHAKSFRHVTLKWAKSHHYTRCRLG